MKSIKEVKENDILNIRLTDGQIETKVVGIKEES